MAHSFTELCKPLCHDKAVIHEGDTVLSFPSLLNYIPFISHCNQPHIRTLPRKHIRNISCHCALQWKSEIKVPVNEAETDKRVFLFTKSPGPQFSHLWNKKLGGTRLSQRVILCWNPGLYELVPVREVACITTCSFQSALWRKERISVYKGIAAKSLQSCLTLCDPTDSSPPVSAVPGILQARTLEWVAISFSNAWKWKVKVKLLSHVWLLAAPWTAAYQAPPSMGFSRQEYWSGVPLPSPIEV